MHNHYKSLYVHEKRSFEQDPMATFFQKGIDSMKKLKVLVGVDFGSFRIWQGLGL